MKERISLSTSFAAYQTKIALEQYLGGCGLPRALLELVKLRVSQVNGCAFCVDMHWKELRKQDATEARLYGLLSWREQTQFSPLERAALGWAEAVSNLADGHVPDAVYEEVKQHFSTKALSDLTYAVVAITGWNQLCTALRIAPGSALPTGG